MIRRLLSALLGARRTDDPTSATDFRAGDLASVETDDGQFGVVKILATDAEGVHVRLYVRRFSERPGQVQVDTLETAPFGPGHEEPFSAGHLPLGHASFARWAPVLIDRGHTVVEEELEGYRIWQDDRGGYF